MKKSQSENKQELVVNAPPFMKMNCKRKGNDEFDCEFFQTEESRVNMLQDMNTITAGPFDYNTSTLRLTKNHQEILLTGKENAMMKLFMDNVGRVFSKSILYDLVWGNDIVDDNAIMVYINRLRQKIEDDPEQPKHIQTVRGLGYRFVA